MPQRTPTDLPKNPMKILVETFPMLENTANNKLCNAIKNILQEEKNKQEGLVAGYSELKRSLSNLEDEKNRYKLELDRYKRALSDVENVVREKNLRIDRLENQYEIAEEKLHDCITQVDDKKLQIFNLEARMGTKESVEVYKKQIEDLKSNLEERDKLHRTRVQGLSDQIGELLSTQATLRDDLLSYKKLKEVLTLIESGNSFIVPKEFMKDYLRLKKLVEPDSDTDNGLEDKRALETGLKDPDVEKIDIVRTFERLISDYESQSNKKILKLSYELPTKPGRRNITIEFYKT